ncbi:DUF47 domain-containing protein [Gehongia tenuis]|uniref:DUF47 family protein n=1 Tax=Gehongia tenuis TaxID=2763655 RepID=A0A926HK70_9FIRM|nr:DUF47 family protein [Gehongia tenuis]MBC8530657.1 DUF47 family protein [Gehongia tenuis]
MAKKQDAFYFEKFIVCTDYACRAAHLLDKAMREFDPKKLEARLGEMHRIEHGADEEKHELINVLVKAFITPIEREDIILLSQNIDEMTDKMEDVLLRIYCNNIGAIRPDALQVSELIIRCCEEAKKTITEFPNFRRSKTLHDHIIRINTLEGEADQLFVESMRRLHTTCQNPIEIIVWREIYIYLEKCVDACEHMADTVERIVMKNS